MNRTIQPIGVISKYSTTQSNRFIKDIFDEATNKSTKIVLEHKGDKYQPAMSVVDTDDNELAALRVLTWFTNATTSGVEPD